MIPKIDIKPFADIFIYAISHESKMNRKENLLELWRNKFTKVICAKVFVKVYLLLNHILFIFIES